MSQAERIEFVLARVRIDPETSCWRWIGSINENGYGRCHPAWVGKVMRAHRLSYEVFVGPIPDGMTLDHLCCVRDCVNPEHLEPCTLGENRRRGWQRTMVAREVRLRAAVESAGLEWKAPTRTALGRT